MTNIKNNVVNITSEPTSNPARIKLIVKLNGAGVYVGMVLTEMVMATS